MALANLPSLQFPCWQFSAPLALEKTKEWQKEGASLECSLPSHHRVMQACLSAIGNFQKYLPLLLKLGSHFLKLSCWKEIFAGEGLLGLALEFWERTEAGLGGAELHPGGWLWACG